MILDLRATKCPLNFVQTRLALEKIPLHTVIEVWILEEGESALNIPQSIAQEGHKVVRQESLDDGTLKLWIERLK